MNIFYLSRNPYVCAKWHCLKHVLKMIIEYAQLLSTAHRYLDGYAKVELTVNKRKITRYYFYDNKSHNEVFYKASHINHPSNVWLRQSIHNYNWLYELFCNLCDQYTNIYGKIHATDRKLRKALKNPPDNIPRNISFSEPIQAMPEEYKIENDSISAYRLFYRYDKVRFANWKEEFPWWMK